LTAISLSDGTQDYSIDAGDTDVYKVLRVRIVRTDTTPDQYHDLGMRDWLPPNLDTASMLSQRAAAHEPVSSKIRLESAIAIGSGTTLEIQGEYWTDPAKITDQTLGDAFSFDDTYFPVFVDGMKWKLFQYVNDSRAGTITTDRSGRKTYTGQLGIFMEGLWNMMQDEDYGADGTEFPDAPIGESASAGSAWVYGGG
jgi:hypothetical protein